MKSIIQEGSSIAKAIEQGWIRAGKPESFTIKVLEEAEKNFIGLTKRSAKVALYYTEAPEKNRPQARYSSRTTEQPRQSRHDDHRSSERREGGRRTDERRDERRNEGDMDRRNERRERSAERREQPRRGESRSDMRHEPRQEQRSQEPREYREQRPRPELRKIQEAPRVEHEHVLDEQHEDATPMRQRERPISEWNETMVAAAQEWMATTLNDMGKAHITFTIEPRDLHLRIIFSDTLTEDALKERQLLASFALFLIKYLKQRFGTPLRGHKIILAHTKHAPRSA